MILCVTVYLKYTLLMKFILVFVIAVSVSTEYLSTQFVSWLGKGNHYLLCKFGGRDTR